MPDLATLTLICTVLVTPIVGSFGYVIKRRWDQRDAEKKADLAKIDELQTRIVTILQDQIKAEVARAANAGDTNQLLKSLAATVDTLTQKAKAAA